ncbi:hypothetical protein BK129_01535 [Paenibacillus amylolyticus]|uniref:hypothetical protein n=1 Tax=Paenibacillus amylolyticus TaxID=1451 RepID=UPI00096D0029|nr:hypothetical protein [Paenibacillus amylolyticus]OMF09565.1 hypothetical protein BK129_01535 [Paenibacillus amylolyticus]
MAKSETLNYTVISAFNDKQTNTLIEPGTLYPADQKRANVLKSAGVIAEDDEGQALPKQSKTDDSDKDKDKTQDVPTGGASDADDTKKS